MTNKYSEFTKTLIYRGMACQGNSIKGLAEKLGVSERSIYRWLNGGNPPAYAMLAICDLIGIDFSLIGKIIRKSGAQTLNESEHSFLPYMSECPLKLFTNDFYGAIISKRKDRSDIYVFTKTYQHIRCICSQ